MSAACTGCGMEREDEELEEGSRVPCEHCGSDAITFSETATISLTMSVSIAEEYTPGRQTLDWRREWSEIQRELAERLAPQEQPSDLPAIDAEFTRLRGFFTQTYHLRDALVYDAPSLGLTEAQIDQAISADADLALLRDLAVTVKHFQMTSKPRSGDAPTFAPRSSQSPYPGLDHGWRLKAPILHAGNSIDGQDAAQRAVDAWRQQLQTWQLI